MLVTHSRGASGLFLPWCWSPTATVPQGCPCPVWITRGLQCVPFLTRRSSLQECISSPTSPQLSFPPSVSLRASLARLLSATAAGHPEISLSQGAVGSSAWLSSGAWWSPTLVSAVAGPSCGWHSVAHGFPPHQSPPQPALLEPSPACPTRGETYLK